MMTPENILSHEFIGTATEIIKSSNNKVVGLNGVIVDETKSMFTIKTEKGMKKIPKNHNTWSFQVKGQTVTIEGRILEKKPHERIGVKQ